jgi:large subunit ribosomal protein L18
VIIKKDKNIARKIRHARVRKKVSGTEERPRLSVYRSLKHLYVQLINDENGTTLVAASTLDPALRDKVANMTKKEAARCVGEAVAKKALEKGIKQVVFDRSGYIYHGRIMEVAAGAREVGLDF